jgi:hypothetical protein
MFKNEKQIVSIFDFANIIGYTTSLKTIDNKPLKEKTKTSTI